jgi:hypothetical protein
MEERKPVTRNYDDDDNNNNNNNNNNNIVYSRLHPIYFYRQNDYGFKVGNCKLVQPRGMLLDINIP